METTIFIDGRNFLSKINDVLNLDSRKEVDFSLYNFSGLLEKVLLGLHTRKRIFYLGKLLKHPETVQKSEELIEQQRKLKLHLEEKGVDVRIAVDMITTAYNKDAARVIIGSSDSDLQPAILELKKHGVELIYLGFETSPNKGLMFTTHRSIIIRNSEVLEFVPKQLV